MTFSLLAEGKEGENSKDDDSTGFCFHIYIMRERGNVGAGTHFIFWREKRGLGSLLLLPILRLQPLDLEQLENFVGEVGVVAFAVVAAEDHVALDEVAWQQSEFLLFAESCRGSVGELSSGDAVLIDVGVEGLALDGIEEQGLDHVAAAVDGLVKPLQVVLDFDSFDFSGGSNTGNLDLHGSLPFCLLLRQ